MSQRLTRKEIKQKDQFVTSVEHTLDYGKSHLRPILLGVGAAVGAILLAVLVVFWLRHRADQANVALSEAMETLDAPVTGTEGEGDEETFADETARRAKAKERFEGVRDAFGSSSAGKVASLYLAKFAAEDGDLAGAQKLWGEYAESGEKTLLAAQVELNLLALEREEKGAEAVVEKLKGMLESDRTSLPEDVVLFELGSALEDLSRGPEALPYYQRIVDEFPRSMYSSEARQKTTQLAADTTSAG